MVAILLCLTQHRVHEVVSACLSNVRSSEATYESSLAD